MVYSGKHPVIVLLSTAALIWTVLLLLLYRWVDPGSFRTALAYIL
jgi:hypothetical protein